MENPDFEQADIQFRALHSTSALEASPLVRMVAAIRANCKGANTRRYAKLASEIRPLAAEFGQEISADPRVAYERVCSDLNAIRRGERPLIRPAYLKWLWLHHRADAEELFRQFDIQPFARSQNAAAMPNPVSTRICAVARWVGGQLSQRAFLGAVLASVAAALLANTLQPRWNGLVEGLLLKAPPAKEARAPQKNAPAQPVAGTKIASPHKNDMLASPAQQRPNTIAGSFLPPVSTRLPVKASIQGSPAALALPSKEALTPIAEFADVSRDDLLRALRLRIGRRIGSTRSGGDPIYLVTMWLQLSAAQRASILSVRYYFDHPDWNPKNKPGGTASAGFPVSWDGYACISDVSVTVTLRSGAAVTAPFDLCALWNDGRIGHLPS